MQRALFLSLIIIFLSACGADTLNKKVEVGDNIFTVDFEKNLDFETGDFPNGSLTIENGIYRIQKRSTSAEYLWGQAGQPLQNVNIEVNAMPQTDYKNNLYGVMCRVDPEGNGYVFLVSADGYAAIARTANNRMDFIRDWAQHSAIKTGVASNKIRAVCADDYLALYVNDTLVMDVEDQKISAAGQVGLIAGVLSEKDEEETIVHFDNLIVSEVKLE